MAVTDTPVAPRPPASAHAEPVAPSYSRDYWDGVFDQVGKQRRVKIALAILALLYAIAVYAPLIANDRPLYLSAVDARGFQSAQRSVGGVATNYARLVREGEEKYLANLSAEATLRTFAAARAAELGAIRLRTDLMRASLPEEAHGPLDAFDEALAAFDAALQEGESAEAISAAEQRLRDAGRALRSDIAVFDARRPEAGGVRLEPVKRWPAFEQIGAIEAFFMVLWLWVLTWPLWNRFVNRVLLKRDRERIRRARRKKLAAVLATSALLAFAWGQFGPTGRALDAATFKEDLASGRLEDPRVVMAPIPMGFTETHLNEPFRPPTWHSSAELDERGYYVRGRRVPEPNPITGVMPPENPVELRYGEAPVNSPWRFLFGTDATGRDLTARLVWGARVSLTVGLLSTTILVTLGVLLGSIMGYAGGIIDLAFSRLIEIVQSIPTFFLILVAVAVIDPRVVPPIVSIVVVIGLVGWTGVARLVRGEFLKLKGQDFVVAARAQGFRTARIVFRHVLPNALGPVLVAASFAVASGILIESSISFLGFGVKVPVPSWGTVINESREPSYWWIHVFSGFLIFLTIFCYNMVGEGLRDALDPRMKT